MAATFSFRAGGEGFHPEKVPGAYFDAIIIVTAGTTDYTAGGYAFGITQLKTLYSGASLLESVDVVNHWGTDGGTAALLARWDNTNQKVQAFGTNGAAPGGLLEIANNNAVMNGLFCALRVRFR